MSRFLNLFRKKRLDRQMDEEFEFHLDQLAAQLMNSGMTRHQALREARRQFGSLQSVREVYRDQQGVPWLADLFADLRHGLRLMNRNRDFSTIAVLTMAIGIGATASIFSFVNAVYLRPAPYPNAARLVDVVNEVRGYWNGPSHTSRRYLYFKERTQLFEEVAGWKGGGASTMVVQGEAEQVAMRRVSSNYFRTFGIAPRAGRFFLPEEDAVGAAKVVVLGFRSAPIRKNCGVHCHVECHCNTRLHVHRHAPFGSGKSIGECHDDRNTNQKCRSVSTCLLLQGSI